MSNENNNQNKTDNKNNNELSIRSGVTSMLAENPDVVLDLGKQGVNTLVNGLISISEKIGELTSEAQLKRQELEAYKFLAALEVARKADEKRADTINKCGERYKEPINKLTDKIATTESVTARTQLTFALRILLQSKNDEMDHINNNKKFFFGKLFTRKKKKHASDEDIIPME